MKREELQRIVLAERRAVPQCNWKNYDTETRDYIDAILAEPERFEELSAKLWQRIQRFKQVDLSHIPPVLLRRRNETAREWINRCYNAGGYLGGF